MHYNNAREQNLLNFFVKVAERFKTKNHSSSEIFLLSAWFFLQGTLVLLLKEL